MAIATYDYEWEQGEDHFITITYNDPLNPVIPGQHEIRMDIAPLVQGVQGAPVWSFNSIDFPGTLDVTGAVDNEGRVAETDTLVIKIPRSATLNKVVADGIAQRPPVKTYVYDVFIRNMTNDMQIKILKGKIKINRSVTHWL